MRIAIAGAGSVGRSIAGELVENGHQVMLIDRDPEAIKPGRIEAAEWVLADACEVALLEDAGLQTCDVVIACTGDDKVNLVVSLLAKTEFAVGRVVGRVNDPRNEWLFTDAWGVDVAVSTPRILAALVEEAVTVGDLVRLFTLRQGQVNLVEVTLPPTTSIAGRPVRDLRAAAGRGAGDDPARRPGHRAAAGRAAGARRRAAVRRLHRGRGPGPGRAALAVRPGRARSAFAGLASPSGAARPLRAVSASGSRIALPPATIQTEIAMARMNTG